MAGCDLIEGSLPREMGIKTMQYLKWFAESDPISHLMTLTSVHSSILLIMLSNLELSMLLMLKEAAMLVLTRWMN